MGFELRRPHCDYLVDGIYELRVRHRTSQLRLLYFFHGKNVVVVSHGLTKESTVPKSDIALAISRMRKFDFNSEKHSAEWEDE